MSNMQLVLQQGLLQKVSHHYQSQNKFQLPRVWLGVALGEGVLIGTRPGSSMYHLLDLWGRYWSCYSTYRRKLNAKKRVTYLESTAWEEQGSNSVAAHLWQPAMHPPPPVQSPRQGIWTFSP